MRRSPPLRFRLEFESDVLIGRQLSAQKIPWHNMPGNFVVPSSTQ